MIRDRDIPPKGALVIVTTEGPLAHSGSAGWVHKAYVAIHMYSRSVDNCAAARRKAVRELERVRTALLEEFGPPQEGGDKK